MLAFLLAALALTSALFCSAASYRVEINLEANDRGWNVPGYHPAESRGGSSDQEAPS